MGRTVGPDQLLRRGKRTRIGEIRRLGLEAETHDVPVGVDEPRQQAAAAAIDHLGRREGAMKLRGIARPEHPSSNTRAVK